MTNHCAFYKHPRTGRVVQTHTTAEAMNYERRGYVICGWSEWYTYYMHITRPVAQDEHHAADVLRKDGEVG